ncbi:hypothetical protein [Microbacterium sp. Ag1]|uniref:hypothetical protein n=1 Tax=Microbacterium sp. Ag1 TaxID=1643443 RepID=UPI0006293F95|nr:hypothetical protein [Microbacterium sp. Ag1]KKX96685.1 hypothetical protein AAY78_15310 [Microbacterium sp. Ag1]
MNKTVIFITFTALAAVGLIGSVALLILRPEASQDFTTLLITVLGLATTAAGTFYALGKQGQEIATIKSNTNGTLTRKEDEIAALRAKLAEHAPEALVEVETGPIDVSDKLRRDLV